MRTMILCACTLLLMASCSKNVATPGGKTLPGGSDQSSNPVPDFIKYTIRQGQQYCDQNGLKTVSLSALAFVVRFDSSAIYTTKSTENQYDINKLYGFSDNNADHHSYSARIGWRWSDGALRLFAYVYNAGIVNYKEMTPVAIGADINCSIKVAGNKYIFNVNNVTDTMPRLSTTPTASGYRLYPYFGGDETAPHEVDILLKELNGQ